MASADFCVVVCFDDARRRFLLVRHRERGWELPGGRLETDETPLHAAEREFLEETGHALLAPLLVLRQSRGDVDAYVVTGRWGPARRVPKKAAEPVVEERFVERLSDVEPLAFPNDPYEEIGCAVGRSLL